jgi:uncharacterized delta-60 repeat protein
MIKKSFIGLGFLVLLLISGVCADRPKLWDKTFGGVGDENGYAVAVDSNNNIIAVGSSASSDFLTVKYDSSGNLLWNKTFILNGSVEAQGVTVDSDNNVIVAGTRELGSDFDMVTVKYDSFGNQLWNDTVWGSDKDEGYGVAVNSQNEVIVVGSQIDTGASYRDVYIQFYTDDGDTNGFRIIRGNGTDVAYDVAVDSRDNVIVAGYTYSFGGASANFWVIKLNSSYSVLWNRTFDRGNYDVAYGVAVDSSNNIIVTGVSTLSGLAYDYLTVKYDANGNLLWNRTAAGASGKRDYAEDVAVDSNDNVIITGETELSTNFYDVWTLEYDSNGNHMWNRTIGGSYNDYAYDVAVDSDGNIILAGQTRSFSINGVDLWMIKYGTPVCDDNVDNDGNGLTDCEDAECSSVHTCQLWNKSFVAQPTIVTLQGKLTNASSGVAVSAASMRVNISNSTGQVWFDSFNNALVDGVFNIPLGASKPLSLVRDTVYSIVIEADVGSATFSAADVVFGDNNPAGEVIKFTA